MNAIVDHDLIGLKMELTDISNKYIDVHNAYMQIMKFSLEGLFKRKNYEPLHNAAIDVLQQLDDLIGRMGKLDIPAGTKEHEFQMALRDYVKSLRRTIEILAIILRNLNNKMHGNASYPSSIYSNDFNNYNAAITIHLKNKDIFKEKYEAYRSGTE